MTTDTGCVSSRPNYFASFALPSTHNPPFMPSKIRTLTSVPPNVEQKFGYQRSVPHADLRLPSRRLGRQANYRPDQGVCVSLHAFAGT